MSPSAAHIARAWFRWGWLCGACAGLCLGCAITAIAMFAGSQAA